MATCSLGTTSALNGVGKCYDPGFNRTALRPLLNANGSARFGSTVEGLSFSQSQQIAGWSTVRITGWEDELLTFQLRASVIQCPAKTGIQIKMAKGLLQPCQLNSNPTTTLTKEGDGLAMKEDLEHGNKTSGERST